MREAFSQIPSAQHGGPHPAVSAPNEQHHATRPSCGTGRKRTAHLVYVTRDSKQIKHIRSERITTADVEDRREPKFSSPDVLDLAREGEGVVVVEDSYPIHSEIVYNHVHERTCLPMLDHWTQNWMKLVPPSYAQLVDARAELPTHCLYSGLAGMACSVLARWAT